MKIKLAEPHDTKIHYLSEMKPGEIAMLLESKHHCHAGSIVTCITLNNSRIACQVGGNVYFHTSDNNSSEIAIRPLVSGEKFIIE